MSTSVIACEVMQEELLAVAQGADVRFAFLPMRLHLNPARLRAALADKLCDAHGVGRIVLGFGLCGGALVGLTCQHAPLVIPRVHDCIGLLMGKMGAHRPRRLDTGTFYMSAGWSEGERTLLSEHHRAIARYGEEKAKNILVRMLDGYEKLLFIRTRHPRREAGERQAAALSALTQLPLRVVDGSDRYLRTLVNGPWSTDDFVHVPVGASVALESFGAVRADVHLDNVT